jgi:spoIIIJ-associated protein
MSEETIEVVEEAVDKSSLLDQEGDAAADYLEGLLDIADLDGDIDIDVEGDRAMVSIVEVNAGDLADLVGEDGATLDALQELTRLAAARETGERSRLMLDIAGFRAAKKAAVEAIAASAIAECQRTAAPVKLDPMNPFERKVVHDVVTAAGLVSESEGEEPNRRIVVRLP